MFVLDTNVLIALQKLDAKARAHYRAANAEGVSIGIPALVRFEARCELIRPLFQKRLAALDVLLAPHATLALDQATVDRAAELFETLRASGNLIENMDLLIAATALQHDATLITNNTKHFSRIEGLRLEDWQA